MASRDSEILILDEVFAAGDKKFREKSEARIQELYQNTTTILVTHCMKIVKDIADRVIVLKKVSWFLMVLLKRVLLFMMR